MVKKQLPPQLSKVFETFPKAIVDTHGKDLVASPTASGQATPLGDASGSTATPVATSITTSGSVSTPSSKPVKKVANSSTVRVEAQFMVSAPDLFDILTNEARIPQWTRAPAQVCDNIVNGIIMQTDCQRLYLSQSQSQEAISPYLVVVSLGNT